MREIYVDARFNERGGNLSGRFLTRKRRRAVF